MLSTGLLLDVKAWLSWQLPAEGQGRQTLWFTLRHLLLILGLTPET